MNRDNKKTLSIHRVGKKAVPISLVNRALEELTSRASAGVLKQRKRNVDRLCKSVLTLNGKPREVVNTMLDSGIPIKEVFEVFIPDAARQLGDYWIQNTLSFAEVTLATSKLQTIARTFESLYVGTSNSGASGPEIMVINPRGEQHTFGAQMIARQFQRLGASPYLSINDNVKEIKKIITKHKFELVGLSLSDYKLYHRRSELRSIIKLIKRFGIPIIAGGSLIHSHKSMVKSLNVDIITDDAVSVLRYFHSNFSIKKNISDIVTA